MAYSTGRGGAGNIHFSKTKTTEDNELSPQISVSKSPPPQQHQSVDNELKPTTSRKVYYSTGRGGAGNIRSSDEVPSPQLAPQGSNTPVLTQPRISTGRGGYGNMVENDDPGKIRKLQDVDGDVLEDDSPELEAIKSNKSYSVGRGGFGNIVSRDNVAKDEGGETPNLYTVTSRNGEKNGKKKMGIWGKIKHAFS
ncbi:uncharacterized protein LODBEIA_P55790 [Lodderomyces beijingensis]|uniref:Protein kinase domain-containing protein n=1 Tax=Lodderomyces beijingensis TaxID=1775926 RepID=A0ABP0ZWN8_9ASCO